MRIILLCPSKIVAKPKYVQETKIVPQGWYHFALQNVSRNFWFSETVGIIAALDAS
jgi:hypothetical protein